MLCIIFHYIICYMFGQQTITIQLTSCFFGYFENVFARQLGRSRPKITHFRVLFQFTLFFFLQFKTILKNWKIKFKTSKLVCVHNMMMVWHERRLQSHVNAARCEKQTFSQLKCANGREKLFFQILIEQKIWHYLSQARFEI
jgi:hypothetical protein